MAARATPLTFDSGRKQIFVVGNEAADADSLVTAYAIAAFLDSSEVQGVALAQIPREEFRLRGDSLQLFKEAGSEVLEDGSPGKLHFWDEIDWKAVDGLDSRRLVLTDHNKMTAQVARHFEGRVQWVLDHHAGGGSYPDAKSDIDESLGSASSLAAEQFMARGIDGMPLELGVLLAGVILLDTRNFDPKENKGTPRDRAAMDRLAAFVPKIGHDAWYKQLMHARKDVSHLSVRELMLLDTKVVTLRGLQVAFASMMSAMPEVMSKASGCEAFKETARSLARDRGYKAVVCLFPKDKATGKKGLALVPLESSEAEGVLCSDLVKELLGTPGNLPQELRENVLYQTQGLVETGFQLEHMPDLEPLEAYSIKADVSRKTLLPLAMNLSKI